MRRNFNLYFNSKLDAQGENPIIKTLSQLTKLKKSYDSHDTWI